MTFRTFPPARKVPPSTALLLAFLARGPFPETWALRGSVVTRAHNPRGRDPVDLDYVVTSPAWEPDVVVASVEALLRRPPSGHDAVAFGGVRAVPIWEETRFPGVRAYVEAKVAGVPDELQIDFGWGDPIETPLETIMFHGVGPLRAVSRETMIARARRVGARALAAQGPARPRRPARRADRRGSDPRRARRSLLEPRDAPLRPR